MPKSFKTVNFDQKMAKFWPSQIFPGIYTMIFSKKTTRVVSIPKTMKISFSGHLSHMETQLHAKNQKKILNGQGCRTGTNGLMDGCTDERTNEREFIGSFRSLKTSGEPKT